ncbi:motility associated factor glycosyltransferase family protein [Paenibacillus sp. FSL H8-0034]|uniref:motility associated factor glycosyltransferase family protein n=1 Tax=Paenibacillus sp. FSL H8-0034 TaxID=2954671 RepID=UPI0030F9BD81
MSYETENKLVLQNFPLLIRYLEAVKPSAYLSIKETSERVSTLRFEKDQCIVDLHHPDHPLQEARDLIAQLSQTSDYQHVLFYGVGFGYHIDEFVRKFPSMPFSIYEPDGEIFHYMLSHRSIRNWNPGLLRNIYLEKSAVECPMHLKHFIDKCSGKVLVVALPSYKQIYKERTHQFSTTLEKLITRKKINLQISRGFQRNWTENCIANFPYTLTTPNILDLRNNPFYNRPVILVAAGPSLDDELEVLKEIKSKGSAYIFSVGSAINTLVERGIYPDAACTYDPSPHNVKVFQKVIDRNISTIPLLFGTSVDLQTIQQYPGPKLHMITSQDSISRFLLRTKGGQMPAFVNDASSIAIVALQLLFRLGCSTVILVGQNCAYRNKKHYASGIDYAKTLSEREMNELILVESVNGDQVETSPSMKLMREEIETYIKMHPKCEVINCTKDGARIEGAPFKQLKSVLDEKLREQVVEMNWCLEQTSIYDEMTVKNNGQLLMDQYQMLTGLFQELMSILFEIELSAKRLRTDRMKALLNLFDLKFKSLQKNIVFQIILMPLNQVQYEVLYGQIETLRLEVNLVPKGHKLVEMFGDFIVQCRDDHMQLEVELSQIIEKINVYNGGLYV